LSRCELEVLLYMSVADAERTAYGCRGITKLLELWEF
jgi:hypothetical protein